MDQQPRVETVEEFKLRIAAIIRGKPEHILGAPRPNPLLVRPKKRAKSRKPAKLRTRVDFLIKKLPPPTPDRYERRLFPPEHFWKTRSPAVVRPLQKSHNQAHGGFMYR